MTDRGRRAEARPTSSSFCLSSLPSTVRRTYTSTSCSAGSASSTTASPPCTTSRRSITRPITPTPPSRRCSTPGAAILGTNPGNKYPDDAIRIKQQWFSSTDQLVTMIMGGEVYLPGYEKAWNIGRQLDLQIAAHILSPFGIRPTLDLLAKGQGGDSQTLAVGSDNLFIHMTGMSDDGWLAVQDKGAQVSIAFPIEMNMRHGMPPILRMQKLGMEPSLSVDVECTMTADFFTQMRVCMNLQRLLVNQSALNRDPAQLDVG